MNAIRPSDPKVPILPQHYVYSADNNHLRSISAELIARGIASGKLPGDAFVAPLGSSAWTPYAQVPDVQADPRLKLLPVGIFAAFALLSLLEVVVVLVARR